MINRISPPRKSNLVRILLPLKPEDWEDLKAENVWAEDVGTEQYRIANVPFYFYDLSVEDIVTATPINGVLTFTRITSRGGHSTYRFLLSEGLTVKHPKFLRYWKKLRDQGCTYESGRRWVAIDVPPKADIYKVYAALEEGEEDGVWSFEEAHCGHTVAKSDLQES